MPLNRHRPLQFVQWTLQVSLLLVTFISKTSKEFLSDASLSLCCHPPQSAPNHPILVDTISRILDTSYFARALLIEQEQQANRFEIKGDYFSAERVRNSPLSWKGTRGREFERTGVEEFTGPGVFTDAVMS